MHTPLFTFLLLVTLHATTPAARADENLFGYSYGSDTLPQGASELYQWITWRHSKYTGTYSAFDLKTEYEYGFTDHFQGSLYLNLRQHTIIDSAPLDDVGQPEYPNRQTGFRFQGIQTSLKYNVSSPYKDELGFSLYFEPGYSRVFKISGEEQAEWSLEFKFILQKNFLENTLVWVLNVSPEFEVRKFEGSDEWERELAFEVSSAVSYRFAPNWFAGIDTRYHSEYPNYGAREHYAVFAGPTVHYGAEKWWFTLTVLPQLFGGPTLDDDPAHAGHAHSHGGVHLSEHERVEIRTKIGFNL